MATTETIPGYIDLYRAAEIIGVSHSQVFLYVRNGLLNAVKIGRTHLVLEREVKKFVRPPKGNPQFLKQSSKQR